MALMIENPVRNPIVPPIADSMSTNVSALSLVTLSNVGVSNEISTNLRLGLRSYSALNRFCTQYSIIHDIFTFELAWKCIPFFVIMVIV